MISLQLFRLSSVQYGIDAFARDNANKKHSFLKNRETRFGKFTIASIFIFVHTALGYYFLNRTSGKSSIPDEFLLPNPELPQNLGNRPNLLFRAQQHRRSRLGLPTRSAYMLEIKDFERDEPYEFRGDFPKRWWKYG